MNPRISVGLEQDDAGLIRAHALDLLGFEALGSTADDAISAFAGRLQNGLPILEELGHPVPDRSAELEIAVDEWIPSDADLATGRSTACFEADRVPLDNQAMMDGLDLLGSLRSRLIRPFRRSRNEQLDQLSAGDVSVRTLLDGLAQAQWWTLTRLGASPMAEVPEQVVARLDTSMALVVERMANLPVERRGLEIELDGEAWTPRKVLRRLLWLEWSYGDAVLAGLTQTAEGR